jgi:hypothetical protein
MARKKSGGSKSSKNQVTVTVVPTQGSSTTKSASLAKKGATLGDTLKAQGIATDRKDFAVNGKPASLGTKLAPGDQVQVSERPQGS